MAKKKNGDLSNHHIIPKIRGGNSNGNLVKIPPGFHQSWHSLFGEMTPEESIEFIKIVFLGKGMKKRKKVWAQPELYKVQLRLRKKSIQRKKTNKKQR